MQSLLFGPVITYFASRDAWSGNRTDSRRSLLFWLRSQRSCLTAFHALVSHPLHKKLDDNHLLGLHGYQRDKQAYCPGRDSLRFPPTKRRYLHKNPSWSHHRRLKLLMSSYRIILLWIGIALVRQCPKFTV